MSETDDAESTSKKEAGMSGVSTPEVTPCNCTAQCCVSSEVAFQPVDKQTLPMFTDKKRTFNHSSTNSFPG